MFKKFRKDARELMEGLAIVPREIINAAIGGMIGEKLTGSGQPGGGAQQPAGNAGGPGAPMLVGVQLNWFKKLFAFFFTADEAAALEAWSADYLTPAERKTLARRLKLIGDPDKIETLPMRMLRKVFASMTPEVRKQTLKIMASDIGDEAVLDYLKASGAIDAGFAGMLVELWNTVNTRTIPWLQAKDKKKAEAIEAWDPGAFFESLDTWKKNVDFAIKERKAKRGFWRRWGERSGFLAQQPLNEFLPESAEASSGSKGVIVCPHCGKQVVVSSGSGGVVGTADEGTPLPTVRVAGKVAGGPSPSFASK